MKAYQLLLAGALLLGPATVSMAQTDTKAVVEQTKQLIQTKGADFDKQVKELYKTNKKNPAACPGVSAGYLLRSEERGRLL